MTKLIITGCPRSGTLFMAHVLNAAGIPTGHEKAVTAEGLDSNIYPVAVCEVSWCAAAYFDEIRKDPDVRIIHLMRNPFDIARSVFNLNIMDTVGVHMQCIEKIFPNIKESAYPELDFVMDWTDWIMNHTVLAFQVELMDLTAIKQIANFFEYEIQDVNKVEEALAKKKVNSINRNRYGNLNLAGYDRLTEFNELANYFGYKMEGLGYAATNS